MSSSLFDQSKMQRRGVYNIGMGINMGVSFSKVSLMINHTMSSFSASTFRGYCSSSYDLFDVFTKYFYEEYSNYKDSDYEGIPEYQLLDLLEQKIWAESSLGRALEKGHFRER